MRKAASGRILSEDTKLKISANNAQSKAVIVTNTGISKEFSTDLSFFIYIKKNK
jgi:hypothetical protein